MGKTIEMDRQQIDPKFGIAQAVERLSKPWAKAGLPTPPFQVIEVARESGLATPTVINTLSQNEGVVTDVSSMPTTLFISDKSGERVNGNKKDAALELAPMKRVIQAARFGAREPRNTKMGDIITTSRKKRKKSPVIKARLVRNSIQDKTYELGKEKLYVRMEPYTEYDIQKKRAEIKTKQAQRAMKRFGILLPSEDDILTPENQEQRAAEQDIAFIMQYVTSIQTAKPVRELEVKSRFLQSRVTGEPLPLFVPWGVRPVGNPTTETEILQIYQTLQNTFQAKGINTQIFIMPADVYATEVNNAVDPSEAEKYFSYITQAATLRGFMVKPWSRIREENMEWYEDLAANLDEKAIRKIVEGKTLEKAFASAKRRSGNFTNRSIQESMYAYLRERIIEAIIVEQQYKPVKVGLAPKFKDDYIDGELPRLYLFPTEKQLPWLK